MVIHGCMPRPIRRGTQRVVINTLFFRINNNDIYVSTSVTCSMEGPNTDARHKSYYKLRSLTDLGKTNGFAPINPDFRRGNYPGLIAVKKYVDLDRGKYGFTKTPLTIGTNVTVFTNMTKVAKQNDSDRNMKGYLEPVGVVASGGTGDDTVCVVDKGRVTIPMGVQDPVFPGDELEAVIPNNGPQSKENSKMLTAAVKKTVCGMPVCGLRKHVPFMCKMEDDGLITKLYGVVDAIRNSGDLSTFNGNELIKNMDWVLNDAFGLFKHMVILVFVPLFIDDDDANPEPAPGPESESAPVPASEPSSLMKTIQKIYDATSYGDIYEVIWSMQEEDAKVAFLNAMYTTISFIMTGSVLRGKNSPKGGRSLLGIIGEMYAQDRTMVIGTYIGKTDSGTVVELK